MLTEIETKKSKKGVCLNTGRTHFKKGDTCYWKGKKFSDEYKQKLSESHKGKTPWNKGKRGGLSDDTILKMSMAHIGEKCGGWKGGVTPINDGLRKLSQYKQWKIAVSKKFNRTCCFCGERSSYCHAHHIVPFRSILDVFLENNKELDIVKDRGKLIELALSYNDLWDINNGIILCKECHEVSHGKKVKFH